MTNWEGFTCSWRSCHHQNFVFVLVLVDKTIFYVLDDFLNLFVSVVEVLGHFVSSQKLQNALSLDFKGDHSRFDIGLFDFLGFLLFIFRVIKVSIWGNFTGFGIGFSFWHIGWSKRYFWNYKISMSKFTFINAILISNMKKANLIKFS